MVSGYRAKARGQSTKLMVETLDLGVDCTNGVHQLRTHG